MYLNTQNYPFFDYTFNVRSKGLPFGNRNFRRRLDSFSLSCNPVNSDFQSDIKLVLKFKSKIDFEFEFPLNSSNKTLEDFKDVPNLVKGQIPTTEQILRSGLLLINYFTLCEKLWNQGQLKQFNLPKMPNNMIVEHIKFGEKELENFFFHQNRISKSTGQCYNGFKKSRASIEKNIKEDLSKVSSNKISMKSSLIDSNTINAAAFVQSNLEFKLKTDLLVARVAQLVTYALSSDKTMTMAQAIDAITEPNFEKYGFSDPIESLIAND